MERTMRNLIRYLLTLAVLALAPGAQGEEHTITDATGRTVTVPATIQRVFAAGPTASVLLYALAPDKLVGWPRPLNPAALAFIAPPYRELPAVGRLTGRDNTVSAEAMLKVRPELIVDFGSVYSPYIALAERTQQQTGLPYVLLDGALDKTPASLRLLGGLLGVSERAGQLARYAEQTYQELDGLLPKIPPEQRPKVYLADGPDGLETNLRGAIGAEIIERVGAVNVAVIPDRQGHVSVAVEQVAAWNPDTIIALDEGFFNKVWNDPHWQAVAAVKAKRVYLSPGLPFGWVDHPTSLNRLLGLKWLSQLFYPDVFKGDIRTQAREFYQLFYHIELSDAQLDTLLANARR
jgi:iron complex transport system substrate-binding protein